MKPLLFYCQHQRQKKYDIHTGEEYIETTVEDIRQANRLIKSILLRKSDNLNGATRNYLEKLKAYLGMKKEDILFTNKEIRKELRIAESTLRGYHHLLLQEGYIKRHKDINGSSFSYEIIDVDEYKNLEEQINNSLDECLQIIQGKAS